MIQIMGFTEKHKREYMHVVKMHSMFPLSTYPVWRLQVVFDLNYTVPEDLLKNTYTLLERRQNEFNNRMIKT
jgi:hypothetical protein